MSMKSQARWFSDLTREEGLEDPTVFLKDGFFDEIPFFSRYDQLPRQGPDGLLGTDRLLIDSCLSYLDDLLSRGRPPAPLLAAITVIKERPDDPIVPSLFVCCGDHRVRATLEALPLIRPRSSLGLHLDRALEDLGARDRYGLLQDSATVPGRPRLFLFRKDPAFPEMAGLDRWRERPRPGIGSGRSPVDVLKERGS